MRYGGGGGDVRDAGAVGSTRRWRRRGQQARHDGNWRWDGERLTLIDHGYTFALPGAILNYSDFVVARHGHDAAGLLTKERDVLTRLLSDPDLLGMARFLLPKRAQALADRAGRMLARDEVLLPKEF